MNSSQRYFSPHMKHGAIVSVTARQQTYCANNLEQGGREVPSPSVAKLWNDSISQLQGTAGETLERPSR